MRLLLLVYFLLIQLVGYSCCYAKHNLSLTTIDSKQIFELKIVDIELSDDYKHWLETKNNDSVPPPFPSDRYILKAEVIKSFKGQQPQFVYFKRQHSSVSVFPQKGYRYVLFSQAEKVSKWVGISGCSLYLTDRFDVKEYEQKKKTIQELLQIKNGRIGQRITKNTFGFEGRLKNGKKSGTWLFCNEEGEKVLKIHYKKNVVSNWKLLTTTPRDYRLTKLILYSQRIPYTKESFRK